MDATNFSKAVRRITVLRADASGEITPIEVFRRKATRKKGTRILGPVERATRQVAEAHARAASSYLGRHASSNAKRKDGWLRDLNVNLMRATRKGSKAIKVNRLFSY